MGKFDLTKEVPGPSTRGPQLLYVQGLQGDDGGKPESGQGVTKTKQVTIFVTDTSKHGEVCRLWVVPTTCICKLIFNTNTTVYRYS